MDGCDHKRVALVFCDLVEQFHSLIAVSAKSLHVT